MSRITQIIEALEAERADAQTRLAWIEQQIDEFRRHDPTRIGATTVINEPASAAASTPRTRRARRTRTGSTPATSAPRRKPATRTPAATPKISPTSSKRTRSAAARPTGRGDMRAQIIAHLNAHPNSTAGEVAKSLDLKPNSTSTRLSQMAKAGVVIRAERGYAVK